MARVAGRTRGAPQVARRGALVLSALLLAMPLSPARGADSPVVQMIDAELAFSKMAGQRGIRDAFLHYLADDSVILAPRPVNGQQANREGPADPGVLSWYPSLAGVSGAGDLGYSTGPYEYRAAAGKAPVGFGHFISMWRRQANGDWKVVFDAGVRNARTAQVPAGVQRKEESRAPAPALAAGALAQREQALRQAEMGLGRDVATQGGTARLGWLAREARFFRDRQEPLTDRESIARLLRDEKAAPVWNMEKVVLAASGDLGYAYGTARMPDGIPEQRAWMRVWSFDRGVWRVKLDLELPIPDGTAKAKSE